MAVESVYARPIADRGFGLAPGPRRFNRKNWDNPVKYKLSPYGDEFDYLNFTELNRVWAVHATTAADFQFNGDGSVDWFPPVSGAAIYRPIPSYDFEAVLQVQRFRTINRWDDMFGLAVVDGSGNGRGYSYDYDGSSYDWQVTNWSYAGTGSAHAAFGGGLEAGGTHVWTVLRCAGGNVQGRESIDGATLGTLNAGNAIGSTPLYLAIVRMISNASEWVRLHRINVYSGPTFFPG